MQRLTGSSGQNGPLPPASASQALRSRVNLAGGIISMLTTSGTQEQRPNAATSPKASTRMRMIAPQPDSIIRQADAEGNRNRSHEALWGCRLRSARLPEVGAQRARDHGARNQQADDRQHDQQRSKEDRKGCSGHEPHQQHDPEDAPAASHSGDKNAVAAARAGGEPSRVR